MKIAIENPLPAPPRKVLVELTEDELLLLAALGGNVHIDASNDREVPAISSLIRYRLEKLVVPTVDRALAVKDILEKFYDAVRRDPSLSRRYDGCPGGD